MASQLNWNGRQRQGSRVSPRQACAVFLAGTFNGWDPQATPMIKHADGTWDISVALAPGRYQFKFVVDGAWYCELACDGTNRACPKCVPNAFGTMNRVIGVEA